MADERMQTGRGIKPVVGNPRLPRMTDDAAGAGGRSAARRC